MSEVAIDLGNLLIEESSSADPETTRLERIKKCSQTIFDELSKLASKIVDHVTVVELPEPTFLLPREKPVPKEKVETRWEKFAKLKNIKKKKKPKFAYDEAKGKYVPTWGKGSKDKPWLVEVSDSSSHIKTKNLSVKRRRTLEKEGNKVNGFDKFNEIKKRNINENETRRLKNIGRSINVTMNSMNSDRKKENQGKGRTKVANLSDASMGKFSRQLDPLKLKKEVAKEFNTTQKAKPTKSLIKRKPMKKKGSRTGNKKN